MEIKTTESIPNELEDDDDDIDELFGWMGKVYDSKEPDYKVTIQNGTVQEISDGTNTIRLS